MREGTRRTTDDTAESDEASADGSGNRPTMRAKPRRRRARPPTRNRRPPPAMTHLTKRLRPMDRLPMTATPTLTPTAPPLTERHRRDGRRTASGRGLRTDDPANVDAGVADQPTDDRRRGSPSRWTTASSSPPGSKTEAMASAQPERGWCSRRGYRRDATRPKNWSGCSNSQLGDETTARHRVRERNRRQGPAHGGAERAGLRRGRDGPPRADHVHHQSEVASQHRRRVGEPHRHLRGIQEQGASIRILRFPAGRAVAEPK